MPTKSRKPARTAPKVDPVDPERAHDDAMRVLRKEYWDSVRGIVEDLKSRVASGEIASEDALQNAVDQDVDGSYLVIYTHANFQVLMCSDHHDAYFEDFGNAPVTDGNINWAALAFATLARDVRDQMSAEGVEVVEEQRRSTRRTLGESSKKILMGRAANGHDGVGSGYDAEVLYPGYGEAMVALYHVPTKEWVAVGTLALEDRDQAALDRVARELASNPGSFGEELVWLRRDPDTYERLADSYDALEASYESQRR